MAKFAVKPPYSRQTVGEAIIAEWVDAWREGRRDPVEKNIEDMVTPILDNEGGHRKLKAVVDPHPGTQRVLRIAVPQAEVPGGQSIEDWINSDIVSDDLGRAVLYGCGR